MLHTPIHPAEELDPDVVQAIEHFDSIARRIRDLTARCLRLQPDSRERLNYERNIEMDMAALDLRAERLGAGWTGQSLLEVIQMDIDRRERRVRHPSRQSSRTHLDRVEAAQARKALAKLALDAAHQEMNAATIALSAVEHAARAFGARRAA